MRRLAVAALAVAALAVAAPAASASAATPFEVIGESPTAPGVDGAAAVVVRFSGVLTTAAVHPSIRPAVPGRWIVARDELVFRPAGAFPPGTVVTVTVPAGITSRSGAVLRRRTVFRFGTSGGSVVRAEQILAELGYLPLRFLPAVRRPPGVALSEREVYLPAHGRFAWGWNAPAALRSLWSPSAPGVLLEGALMSFSSEVGLPVTKVLDPAVWSALVTASRHPGASRNRRGYTYALASKASPETLTVWHDDRQLLVSPANTGIGAAPTADGSFPVYERLASQVMTGVNPDGTPYADPVNWVAYFNGGDAVHYIPRAYYGIPQSLGCVELPWTQAKQVWPYLTIGTIVTVTG